MKFVTPSMAHREPVSHEPGINKRVLLSEHELPGGVRLSQATLAPGERVAPHRHASISEVFYVLDGCGEMEVEGQRLNLSRGCSVCVDRGEEHSLVNNSSAPLELLYFGLQGE